jgi:hypothetical protein
MVSAWLAGTKDRRSKTPKSSGKLTQADFEIPKMTKGPQELERMIMHQVRQWAGCAGFRMVKVHLVADRSSGSNWEPSIFSCGDADLDACEAALRQVVGRLQRLYDLAD